MFSHRCNLFFDVYFVVERKGQRMFTYSLNAALSVSSIRVLDNSIPLVNYEE